MKKILISALALAILTSCGSQNANNQQNNEKNDSNSIVAQEKTTPDLEFCHVQGPVKKVHEEGNIYEFSKDGKLEKINNYDPFSAEYPKRVLEDDGTFVEYCGYKRNDKGEICEENWVEGVVYYVWENGKNVADSGFVEGYEWQEEYEFDNEGRIATICKASRTSEDETYFREENHFEYSNFDSHNNWTTRKDSKDQVEISRTIEYWE
ncbi:MAG: hypothetical protein MJ211_00275 [Bacteroidales bacterium]|nr:hypothetical protein [Bacteroidales bacterium]